jgi:MFS family permease
MAAALPAGSASPPAAGHARAEHRHEHGALFVGALHGLAGSAPILAVLPVARHSPALAFAYLVLFGVGVAVAMIGVSGLLGHVAGRLSAKRAGRGLSWLRAVGAGGSVALGIGLLGAA